MDFCSKYGLNYGFEGSDSEEISDEEETMKQTSAVKAKVTKKVRKADSNVIAVKFDELVSTNKMFAGEPIRCKSCEAMMSETSRPRISEDGKTWMCEFCYVVNDISGYAREQVPNQNDVTFLIEAAPKKKKDSSSESASAAVKSTDDNYLVYCIDISGSMDTIIPLKDGGNQSGMTRLNGVKAACLESIDNLKTQEPNKRVALLLFSDTLKYYGDSTRGSEPILCVGGHGNHYFQQQHQQQQPYGFMGKVRNVFNISQAPPTMINPLPANPPTNQPEIAADIMTNKEKMIALATNQDPNLKPISESHPGLSNRIKALRTEGSTALGPALTFSVGFSSHKPGSQVILCTDGCANVGMGSIDGSDSRIAEKFYEDLADYAKSRGVTVNVISMEGTDCKLALLGKVADKSNGTMNIVNPLKLGEQFKSILENRIVATSVRAKLIVNKYLYIRDEKLETAELKAAEKNDEEAKKALEKEKKSVIEKDIGNANIDTEITFEYGVRKLNKEEKKNAPELKEVPFQLQVYYTAPDGSKAVRVYTKLQEFTKDREQAEANMVQREILFANAAQKASYFTLESNVKAAKYKHQTNMNMAQRRNLAIPQMMQQQQMMVMQMSSSSRAEEMNDMVSNAMYANKKITRNKMI